MAKKASSRSEAARKAWLSRKKGGSSKGKAGSARKPKAQIPGTSRADMAYKLKTIRATGGKNILRGLRADVGRKASISQRAARVRNAVSNLFGYN